LNGAIFDSHYARHFRKLTPEFVGQHPAAHRRLQIESEQRDDFGHRAGVCQQFGNRCIAPCAQAQQPHVIAAPGRKFRLAHSLRRAAHDARHLYSIAGAQLFHGQFQHRLEQPEARLPELELRGMHAHRYAARPAAQVVAGEGALSALIERARGGQRQRVRGNRHAFPQPLPPDQRL
jgi:hypothetical protein